MESNKLVLSPLGHTWIFDIDGTVCKHNGYKADGEDTILPGVKEFFNQIPDNDMIVFVTSRTDEYRQITIDFLERNGLRYNHIIFNAPFGERILVNDDKPSGLCCAYTCKINRDDFNIELKISDNL